MAKLITCPGCSAQLVLPEHAAMSDDVRCPRCAERFPLMERVPISVPVAEILDSSETESVEKQEAGSSGTEPPSSTGKFESIDLSSLTLESFAAKTRERQAEPDSQDAAEFPPAPNSRRSAELSPVEAAGDSTEQKESLSSWEARLKRALAADIEDLQIKTPPSDPSCHSSDSSPEPLPEDRAAIPSLPRPAALSHEFEVPVEDLIPSTGPQGIGDQANEPEEDDEQTVRFNADQTVVNLKVVAAPEALEKNSVSVQTQSARKSRPVRSRTRVAFSSALGVVGIPVGLYVLLWIKGPAADVAHLGRILPNALLPAAMRTDADTSADRAGGSAPEEQIPGEQELQPEVIQDPAVQTASATAPIYRGPTFPLVDGESFAARLEAAKRTAPQLAAGTLSEGASKKLKGQAYMTLCYLAELCSFLNQPGLLKADVQRAKEARQLFADVLATPDVQRDLPLIAGTWWSHDARPSQGIVLAGTVERLQATEAGQLAFVSLRPEDTTPLIPVLQGRDFVAEGAYAAFVGTILSGASEQIPAIGDSLDQIVVAHCAFPLKNSP